MYGQLVEHILVASLIANSRPSKLVGATDSVCFYLERGLTSRFT